MSQAALTALLRATPQLREQKAAPIEGEPAGVEFFRPRSSNQSSIGGYADARFVKRGEMGGDSRAILAVPLISGGTGGDFTVLIYAADSKQNLKYAGSVNWGAGHIGVSLTFAAIVVAEPIYATNDPTCCPSAFLIELYQIRKGKLVRVGSANIPKP